MSMRWRWPRQSISKPPCTSPSRCMRAPTPASSSRSTQTCSSTPARMRPSTCSPVCRSRITASMPALASSCPSSRPDGPAPTIATWVRARVGHAPAPSPARRLASAAAGEAMNASSARAASGCARARADGRRERGDDLDRRRQRPEHVDAVEVNQLRPLLEAELHLAARDQRADGNARRRRDDPVADLVGDPPALEQPSRAATPLGPVEMPMVRAASTARRSASSLPMSGRGAPARTATATPERTRSTRCRRRGDPPRAACRSRRAPAPRRRTARRPARARRRRRRRPTRSRRRAPSGPRRRAPARRAPPWSPSTRCR